MGIIKSLSIVCIVMAPLFYGTANAQNNDTDYSRLLQTPLQYTVLRTTQKMMIDGKDDEKDWGKAPWTQVFTDIETGGQINSEHEAKCKMLWDDSSLYLFVKFKERDLWASIRNHDAPVFQDNAFEMFIAPGGETYNYFEFQINAYRTVWDLFMPKPYRNGGIGLTSWDIKGLQKAVHLDGTLNNPTDTDRSWSIELAVPFSSVSMNGSHNPTIGTIWRMNFSRVQWDLDTLNGEYFRRKDKVTGKLFPEHYSVWSPQGIINLHYPERYGYVLFSDTLSTKSFLSPEVEKL
ncbi:MAG: carbohydrate-binding family 9-like protein, partial [Ginsengibacter sp.]